MIQAGQERKGWRRSMKLLIDANVLLDVLMNREGFVKASSLVWKLCETRQAEGYVSALTFANMVYVMRKELDPGKIEEILRLLNLIFEFTELAPADLMAAGAMQWNDFEDALQSVTAERVHADYIVTRNVRDFRRSRIPAYTPSELLAEKWPGM